VAKLDVFPAPVSLADVHASRKAANEMVLRLLGRFTSPGRPCRLPVSDRLRVIAFRYPLIMPLGTILICRCRDAGLLIQSDPWACEALGQLSDGRVWSARYHPTHDQPHASLIVSCHPVEPHWLPNR
jgi:hypothetical protein